MPLRKIKENTNPYCRSPDHSVPMHMVLDNGVYEHVCSGCGKKTIFEVNNPTFQTETKTQWRAVKCDKCYGTGKHYDPWFDDCYCPTCNGSGVVSETS